MGVLDSDKVLEVEVANVLLKASGNLQSVGIPTEPIDMETVEVEKQDRKRQRNRIAATKCRKRKIERITQLQQRIKAKRELEIEVDEIRNRLKIHIKQGCSG